MMDGTLGIGSWLGQFMAKPTHPSKRRGRSGDGLRQTAVVIVIGAALAAGLFAAGNYVVTGQYVPAVVKAVHQGQLGTRRPYNRRQSKW